MKDGVLELSELLAFLKRRWRAYLCSVITGSLLGIVFFFAQHGHITDRYTLETNRDMTDVLTDPHKNNAQLADALVQRRYATIFAQGQLDYLTDAVRANVPEAESAKVALLRHGLDFAPDAVSPEATDDTRANAGLVAYVSGSVAAQLKDEPLPRPDPDMAYFVKMVEAHKWMIEIRSRDGRINPVLMESIVAGLKKTIRAFNEAELARLRQRSLARIEESRESLEKAQGMHLDSIESLERERAGIRIRFFRLVEELRQIEAQQHMKSPPLVDEKNAILDVGGLDEVQFNAFARRLASLLEGVPKPGDALTHLSQDFKELSAADLAIKTRLDLAKKALSSAASGYNSMVASASVVVDRSEFAVADVGSADTVISHVRRGGIINSYAQAVLLAVMGAIMGGIAITAAMAVNSYRSRSAQNRIAGKRDPAFQAR